MATYTLKAGEAIVTGKLQILDYPVKYSIHFWHNTDDTITWQWHTAQPGKYKVALNYSLDKQLTGGVIVLQVGQQQITLEAMTTDSWTDFKIFEIGIVEIKSSEIIAVRLQALKLPKAKNAAMPDIAWLSFNQV